MGKSYEVDEFKEHVLNEVEVDEVTEEKEEKKKAKVYGDPLVELE